MSNNQVDSEQLAQLPEANPLPVLLCDETGRVLYRNPAADAFPERFGPEVEDIAQVLPADLCEIIRGLLDSGMTLVDDAREIHGRALVFTYSPIDRMRRIFVIIVDETERIRAAKKAQESARELGKAYRELQHTQERLAHSAKMAGLGSLVAGIAHELNSPLGALLSNTDSLSRCLNRVGEAVQGGEGKVGGPEAATRFLQLAHDLNSANQQGLKKVAGIVVNLRSFARTDRASRDDADLHEGLEGAIALLGHELQRGIRVTRDYRLERRVLGSHGELNHVFMNLLLNAAQAIPAAGVIKISTWEEDGEAVVEIVDNGKGIPSEILGRVFDPGFTTRGVGVGLGLGLASSYRIVRDHGGRIDVDSRESEGATFTVRLPIGGDRSAE